MTIQRYALRSNTWVPFSGGTPASGGFGDPVFFDDFTGTTLDTTKWTIQTGTLSYDANVALTNRSQNIYVQDSNLHIVAQQESVNGSDYTSGYLHTRNHFSRQYGRFEMRAMLSCLAHNESRGMWPAFWLRPGTGTSGFDGEIDILEAYGTPTTRTDFDPSNRYQWTLHQNEQATHSKISGWSPQGTDLATDFHTYTLDWTPDGFEMFFDGASFKTVKFSDAANTWMPAAFAGPFGIIMNLQVGGTNYWGDPDMVNHPDQTSFPAEMVVDYVKVWAN